MQVMGRGEYRLCKFRGGWGGFSNGQSTYLVVLAVVVWSWGASCVHCVKVVVRLAGSCGRVGGVDS